MVKEYISKELRFRKHETRNHFLENIILWLVRNTKSLQGFKLH